MKNSKMAEKNESVHKTVLLNEAIEGLNLGNKKNPVVIDGTFGGGGHSKEICKRYKNVKIIAIDQDAGAIERAKKEFKNLNCKIVFLNQNFRDINEKKVDGVLLDLGLSSDQLENSLRGFSFLKNEPLLMTMKEKLKEEDITAFEVVNNWEEKNLADVIYGYGEERYARRIAKKIVERRKTAKILTTGDLVEVIASAVPVSYRRGKIHFATKTFQAIRIAVNDELGALKEGLEKSFNALKKEGRLSVITFHSLEDRIVKNFYKEKEKNEEAKIINKKVIIAKDEEIKNNKRSRSAKLRIIEKK